MALQKYSAKSGQSVFDICLQVYGSLNLLYKLIQDSGIDSVNITPFTGQEYTYDDALVTDQAINNKNKLGGIIYATDTGLSGNVYYIIKQKTPRVIKTSVPGGPGGPINTQPPITIEDMAVYGTSYTSNADGTTIFYPTDKDGLSMAARGINIVQLEREIKPLKNLEYQWDTVLGKVTLLGGATLDNTQTAFIIYSQPI